MGHSRTMQIEQDFRLSRCLAAWRAMQFLLALGLASLASLSMRAAPSDPATFLYDAPGLGSGELTDQSVSEKKGWVLLEEDDAKHAFVGSVVLMNDKVAAVLRPESAVLDVFSRQTQGVKLCARLQPVCAGRAESRRVSLSIKDNNRGSIEVEAGVGSGGSTRIGYALSAGAPFLKTTGSPGLDKLRVEAPCRWAVLPDFFGDDILVDAAAIPLSRTELPSENFLLHMIHGGEAILMTVSEARDNDIEIRLSADSNPQITSSDISYGSKPHIWVALLAGKGMWHQRAVTPGDAGQQLDLDWQMPFPALWRVDWSTADKLTDSWEMLLQDAQGKYVMQGWFGQDESVGQRFGNEFGARDWNKPGRNRWNPVLGSFTFPCWVDTEGQGHLQPLKERRYSEGGRIYNFVGPVIVYPMDRANAAPFQTPIDQLTVVDLVRMTLGVGPCQFILDLEGQKRNSRGVATCYARDVINAIYKNGTQLQNKPVIDEHLKECVAFIRNVRERIDGYVQFGHEMTAYLEEQKRLHPAHSAFLDDQLLATRRLDQFYRDSEKRIFSPGYAQRNADLFRERLLDYTEKDAPEKCAAQMAVFTSIGGAQDGLVASCRMIVKTLRQRAAIAMALDPELKEIATEIRNRTQAVLRNPTPYEAPRH
jgi:hypothetical protein